MPELNGLLLGISDVGVYVGQIGEVNGWFISVEIDRDLFVVEQRLTVQYALRHFALFGLVIGDMGAGTVSQIKPVIPSVELNFDGDGQKPQSGDR